MIKNPLISNSHLNESRKDTKESGYLAQPVASDRCSFQELDIAVEIIFSALKNELLRCERVNPQKLEDVKKFILQIWFEERLYSLFVPETLRDVSRRVFERPTVRDFVLNWSTACAASLSVSDFSIERLVETITRGICLNRQTYELSSNTVKETDSMNLIDSKIRLSMHVEIDTVRLTLADNFWLLCLIVVYLYLPDKADDVGVDFVG